MADTHTHTHTSHSHLFPNTHPLTHSSPPTHLTSSHFPQHTPTHLVVDIIRTKPSFGGPWLHRVHWTVRMILKEQDFNIIWEGVCVCVWVWGGGVESASAKWVECVCEVVHNHLAYRPIPSYAKKMVQFTITQVKIPDLEWQMKLLSGWTNTFKARARLYFTQIGLFFNLN